VGLQDALGQGPGLRGLPRARVLLALRDAAVEHRDAHGRRLPSAPGSRRHRRLPARDRGAPAPVDDDPVDTAEQPRRRGQPGHRLRRRREGRTPVRARRGPAGALRARVRRRAHRRPAPPGQRARRPDLHATVRLLRRPSERAPGARCRLRHHRGRHRRGAPGSRVRRGRQDRVGRRRHRAGRPGRQPGPVHRRGAPVRRAAGLRGEQADRRGPQGRAAERRRPAAAGDLRPPVPALLALRQPAHLQGGVVVVRQGDGVQGPDGRAQPADPLGAGAHQGRLVRQVAGERARLVDQPEPVLGEPDPGLGQ
jgi:hypothetical protein